jgi:hypothetical protein
VCESPWRFPVTCLTATIRMMSDRMLQLTMHKGIAPRTKATFKPARQQTLAVQGCVRSTRQLTTAMRMSTERYRMLLFTMYKGIAPRTKATFEPARQQTLQSKGGCVACGNSPDHK